MRPPCLLCGCPCAHADCRYVPLQAIRALVRQRCAPTAFHYAALHALPEGGRHMLCPPCVNWRRRSRGRPYTRFRRVTRRPTLTPFDRHGPAPPRARLGPDPPGGARSMLLHALAPGFAEDPDQRCLPRLCNALLDPRNGYASLVPAPAHAVLREVAARLALGPPAGEPASDAVARAWWDANERSPFFRHPLAARAVRRLQRRPAAPRGPL